MLETFDVMCEEDATTCPACGNAFGSLCDGVHRRCVVHGHDVGPALLDGECIDCLMED